MIDLNAACSTIMSVPIVTIDHDKTFLDVCTDLETHNIEHIPVMKHNHVVGVIHSQSIIDFMGL